MSSAVRLVRRSSAATSLLTTAAAIRPTTTASECPAEPQGTVIDTMLRHVTSQLAGGAGHSVTQPMLTGASIR